MMLMMTWQLVASDWAAGVVMSLVVFVEYPWWLLLLLLLLLFVVPSVGLLLLLLFHRLQLRHHRGPLVHHHCHHRHHRVFYSYDIFVINHHSYHMAGTTRRY